MISFKRKDKKLILCYSSDQPSPEWVYHEIEKSGRVTIGKAFSLTNNELRTTLDDENKDNEIEFEVATKEGEYYRFPSDLVSLDHDLFIHEGVDFERKFFVAERGISIFPKIDGMVEESVYIGGDNEGAIPLEVYTDLLKAFPNTYELNRYASARISGVLS